jgi:hypothetical protein
MRKLLLGSTLCLAAAAAQADEPQAYVGAGVTQARLDDFFGSGSHFDLDNTAWKAFVGVRPLSLLGIEADYMSLGSENRYYGFGSTAHADAHAFAAYAVGFLPIPIPFAPVDLFAKAGAARWDLSGHTNPSFFALDDHGTNFAWGFGSQAHYGPWGIRLEYEQFNVPNTNGVQAVTFDVSFRFL